MTRGSPDMNHDDCAEGRRALTIALIVIGAGLLFIFGVGIIGGCDAHGAEPKAKSYREYKRPLCEWCARPGQLFDPLSVHHNLTQARHPELVNVETNLTTLHMVCQRIIGHWRNTRLENPNGIDIVKQYGLAPWIDGKQVVRNPQPSPPSSTRTSP